MCAREREQASELRGRSVFLLIARRSNTDVRERCNGRAGGRKGGSREERERELEGRPAENFQMQQHTDGKSAVFITAARAISLFLPLSLSLSAPSVLSFDWRQ